MSNDELDQRLYRYPDSKVLRNKFDITDRQELDRHERLFVATRIKEGVPEGNFDLKHLQDIHRHLFQDVYEWAGELRQTQIHKTHQFMPPNRIETAMSDVQKRLVAEDYLRGQSPQDFAQNAGPILGDVNFTHPFREGNGRTQMQYMRQLAEQAGHTFDERRIQRDPWIAASMAANEANFEPMCQQIGVGIGLEQERYSDMVAKRLSQAPDNGRDRDD